MRTTESNVLSKKKNKNHDKKQVNYYVNSAILQVKLCTYHVLPMKNESINLAEEKECKCPATKKTFK